jgi:capsular exopolysaccharide synthesis family protein
VVRGVQLDYEAARTAERELEGRLAAARNSARDINREEFQLAVLQREVDTNRQLYQMFLSREKEMSVAAEVQAAVARVIDPAIVFDQPVSPKRTQLVLLAFVLATISGAFLLLLRAALDKTLKGGEDAERRLKLPVLGAVPALEGARAARCARMVQEEPGSEFAEAMRTVRTGVILSNPDQPDKTLLVTSALPGEGKSTVALNLALTLSQTRRTLLIDADLRRGQIGAKLGLAPNAAGVTQLIGGLLPPQDCVHVVDGTNLKVIPAGELPPQPLELLMSRRFEDMLAALRQHFAMIIIDAPPLEAVSDALVLAPRVTGTLLVSRASATPFPVIRRSVERLRRANASIMGVVLNHVDYSSLHQIPYAGSYGTQSKWQASVLPTDGGNGALAAGASEPAVRVG